MHNNVKKDRNNPIRVIEIAKAQFYTVFTNSNSFGNSKILDKLD